MITSTNKIEQALAILDSQDWTWMMAEYTNPAYGQAKASMRAFVDLVASIKDSVIVKALRELWIATYTYAHKTMFHENEEAKTIYETTKAHLMAIIKPTYAAAA